MDFDAMRQAYLRALDYKKEVFNSFCNLCKSDYLHDSGEIIDVVTVDKVYKVWYCQPCLDKEEELV